MGIEKSPPIAPPEAPLCKGGWILRSKSLGDCNLTIPPSRLRRATSLCTREAKKNRHPIGWRFCCLQLALDGSLGCYQQKGETIV